MVSDSNIAGWGLFAMEKILKGEFIAEYVGEVEISLTKVISQDEADKREGINELDNSTYMFVLNNEVFKLLNQTTIDARMMGNKIRFANHSKMYQNATTRV